MILAHLMRQFIRHGTLGLIDATGQKHVFGGLPGPKATMRLHDKALHRKIFLNPRLSIGEAYMDGTLTIEEGTLHDVLTILMGNLMDMPPSVFTPFVRGVDGWLRRLQQYNPVGKSQANVAHHYDLSDDLYDLFLDADRQYSCAYFRSPDDTLEQAQLNKKRHLAAKLQIKPGMKVLDIGSGWGGLALFLAQETGADVTGLTLSVEQHKRATERAAAAGLSDRVRFLMRDYREETGRYDRIVSVGMFEHVGVTHFQTFFNKIRDLLTDDGIGVLHAIGRMDGPGTTNPWLRKYIFPGGYSPALSEVFEPIEKSMLWATDVEVLRLHYAMTLRHWHQRFMANWDRVKELYDERFCRMWDFYLTGCQCSFEVQGLMVFQIQLAKRVDAVSLTRDYIVDWERQNEDAHRKGAMNVA